jgi:prepilin-type N-terminal cleavage/methylation domain-containing protein
MIKNKNAKKGFTLIELLIVIGILAILATAAVLVLNPAQLLAQARDSQRISDLGAIKSAIGLYLTTAANPAVGETKNMTVSGATCGLSAACTYNATTTVDGNGWVAVNLTGTTGGSPLSSLPLDPTQSATYFYAYAGNNTNKTFELNARLESEKYRGKMTTDGGDDNTCGATYTDATCWYEVGTQPDLNL